ncbi:MAG: AMP-binding protein [Acidimicrobiales bacterium]
MASATVTLFDAATAGDGPDSVVVAGAQTSRAELLGRAGAVAGELAGMRAVAVCAVPTLDTVIAVVAGLLAGVAVVPVPPDAGTEERRHILADCLADAALGPWLWEDLPLPLVPLACTAPSATASSVSAGEQALILYTSGTTGAPRGVPVSGASIAADLDALAEAWAWTADDTLVHGLPLFHVHGLVLGVLGALRCGCRLVHTGRPQPGAYAAAGGSLYFGVPTVWSRICEDPGAAGALRGARLLVSGSAPLPLPVFDRLAALTGHAPVERYGMTETLITLSTRADGERRPGWVGAPLECVETRIVDDAGAAVEADGASVGDLEVRGPTVFAGYLGATTPVSERAGWFRTGDLAAVDAGGFHRIVGRRATDLIKSGGFRIGAGEVEAALLAHPGVRDAAVVGAPDDDLGQVVVAYVVADGRTDQGATALSAFVASRLSAHKRPRRIVFVDALPRNAVGKVQKSRLTEGVPIPGEP